MTLSLARLAEAEKVIAKATPGPWTLDIETDHADILEDELSGEEGLTIVIPEIGRALHDHDWAEPEDWSRDLANGEFIALSRTLLPDLIALVQALGTLGPEIVKQLAADCACGYLSNPDARCPNCVLSAKVQALIPKGETV